MNVLTGVIVVALMASLCTGFLISNANNNAAKQEIDRLLAENFRLRVLENRYEQGYWQLRAALRQFGVEGSDLEILAASYPDGQ